MAISILYSITDSKNKSSTFEINIPSGLLLTQMSDFAAQVATLVNAVTRGAITRVGLVFSVTLPGGIRSAPLANSDVEEGALFTFRSAANFPTKFRIPTFDENLIASNSRAVDLEDASVAALVNAIVSGLTAVGTNVSPTDKRDSDIVALTAAVEQFQSSRA